MTQSQQHITEPLSGFNADAPIVVDIPVSCGRERVAAMIEAATGCSLLGPHDPRAWREERACRAADIRAALGRIKPARKPRRPTPDYLAALASKPGIASVEKRLDGTVVVVPGEPSANNIEMNPWDEVLINGGSERA